MSTPRKQEMFYFYNVTKNKMWVTPTKRSITKIKSDLKYGRHTCKEMQEDYDKGLTFQVRFRAPSGAKTYNGWMRKPRGFKAHKVLEHIRREGDHILWTGPSSIFSTTPLRAFLWANNHKILKSMPIRRTCDCPGCINPDHLFFWRNDD